MKDRRQKRFQQKQRHMNRQKDIYECHTASYKQWAENDGVPPKGYRPGGKDVGQSIHRYHKKNALNCGDSNCVMCGNPRKFFGEKTMQERKFECQAVIDERKDPISLWEWEDLNDPAMEW